MSQEVLTEIQTRYQVCIEQAYALKDLANYIGSTEVEQAADKALRAISECYLITLEAPEVQDARR